MKINVVCDLQDRAEYKNRFQISEKAIHLSADAKHGNVSFDIARLEQELGCRLDSISLDLSEIAAYVYLADKSIVRGGFDNWARDLSFLIPVRNPAKWNSVKQLLRNTVATLTGDRIEFHFVPAKKVRATDGAAETIEKQPARASAPESDCVSLFSGGLDSFAGAVYLLEQGRLPLFLSHFASGPLKKLQSRLISELRKRYVHEIEHVQYRLTSRRVANPKLALKAKESSHRARSFLFMSFAAVVAAARGLSEIHICENGVLALNVPISDARKGSRSTRHAHPLYLQYFADLIAKLYDREFLVTNPFLFWTKGAEAALVKEKRFSSSIKNTVSCWGYPNQTIRFGNSNHCGYCIPCIVRRVSLADSGLEGFDDSYIYDVGARGSRRNETRERNFSDLVYFCRAVSTLPTDALLYRYPEFFLIEAHQEPVTGGKLAKMVGVYKKFANEVLKFSSTRQVKPVSPPQ
jgi:7-cyano-7-deazaguanine synthase in queuosine biosynthesis